MKVVAFAYQEMGAACLETLLSLPGVEVAGVVTHQDDPNEKRWFRSVANMAREKNLPLRVTSDANRSETLAWLQGARPDFLFSFYFRQVLKEPLLATSRVAALNMHGSLLPKYRGRAPTNWAVLNGETETGVTLHHMTRKPDAGDIVASARVPIGPDETAHEVFLKQVEAARGLLRESWPGLADGTAPRIPQDHAQATTFGRRRPEDGRIDWSRPAREIHNLVRAVANPFPGAFTSFRGRRLFIWKAQPIAPIGGGTSFPGRVVACLKDGMVVGAGTGEWLLVSSCQLEERHEMPGADFAREHGLRTGELLGDGP